MLFIAITEAAAFAAASAAGVRLSVASPSIVAITTGLRVAIAQARNSPYLAWGSSVSSDAIDVRLSLTSLAKSGMLSFNVSIDIGPHATFRVAPPTSRLQGHNSSVCRASSTRSVSLGLRPTLRLVA